MLANPSSRIRPRKMAFSDKERIAARVRLRRIGEVEEISEAVLFLAAMCPDPCSAQNFQIEVPSLQPILNRRKSTAAGSFAYLRLFL